MSPVTNTGAQLEEERDLLYGGCPEEDQSQTDEIEEEPEEESDSEDRE